MEKITSQSPEDVLTFLQGPPKVGGCGLDNQAAQEHVEYVSNKYPDIPQVRVDQLFSVLRSQGDFSLSQESAFH
jgi:hypothetical protein